MLYDLMPKEALRSALVTSYSDEGDIDEDQVKRILQAVNRRAVDKAFKRGVGAL